MYGRSRSSYQEGRVGIPLTGLTPPHFGVCSKPEPGFPTPYIVVYFVFSELRSEAIVCLFILAELLTINVSNAYPK